LPSLARFNAVTIAGPIELDNSSLQGFDLGAKIQGINPISGTSNGTEIQKAERSCQ